MITFKAKIATVLAIFLAGCGGNKKEPQEVGLIRVGYFPNITHSQALIGLARGDFQKALGSEIKIDARPFNAGPSVIEAMFAGEIDLAYIGPNPAINGFIQSKGQALRIVAGATSGGAAFIVRREAGIRHPGDLAGKRVASPQLGNTQDVALRNFLTAHGHRTHESGGSVDVLPVANPQILDLFRIGEIDGAWVPEPWASRLIVEGGGEVFLDERSLWPDSNFVTAHVIVSNDFLKKKSSWVEKWIEIHIEITEWEQTHPEEAQLLINKEIGRLTGKSLPDQVLTEAWGRMKPTWDPIATSLYESAESAYKAGFLRGRPDLDSIYDLDLLNKILISRNRPLVTEKVR